MPVSGRRWGSWSAGVLALLAGVASGAGAAEVQADGRVRFRLRPEGGARTVHVAGSWNGWSCQEAWALQDADGDGTFEGTFTVPAGRQEYKFVVDGDTWRPDPEQAETAPDGHGGQNSVLTVGEGQGAQAGARPVTGGAAPFGSVTRPRRPAFEGEIFFLEPGTEKIPDLSQLPSQGKIYSEVFDVAPRSFAEGFPGLSERFEWFAVRYRGTFRAEKSGRYRFRLLSDDGSRLFINGKLALDNDGLHAPREVSQIVQLKEGDYQLTLEYMQGPALDVALQLWVTRPHSTGEELVRVKGAAPADEGQGQ